MVIALSHALCHRCIPYIYIYIYVSLLPEILGDIQVTYGTVDHHPPSLRTSYISAYCTHRGVRVHRSENSRVNRTQPSVLPFGPLLAHLTPPLLHP